MTDTWQSIKIKQFEYVAASSTAALIRISGTPSWRRRGAEQSPTLVVDDGHGRHRFAAIPAPPNPRGTLRAAYSIPWAMIADTSQFMLEHRNGSVTPLSPPTHGLGRGSLNPGSKPAVSVRTEAVRGAPATLTPPSSAEGEPERGGDLFTRFTEQSETVADSERAAAGSDRGHRLAEATAQELVAQAESALAAAQADAASATDRVETARAETADAQTLAAAAARRADELEQSLIERRKEIQALERKVADSSPDEQAVQRKIADLKSSRASLEQELDRSRDRLRMMTLERDELSRQAAAFHGVAVKARERAANAERSNERFENTLSELETWRGELERRLAATTSELSVAKAAREAAERELERLRAMIAEAELTGGSSDRPGDERRQDSPEDSAQTLAAQAAEIEQMAAQLASLRAARPSPSASGEPDRLTAVRLATLEAERADRARRAEQLADALAHSPAPAQRLAELARGGERNSPSPRPAGNLASIRRTAERTAREQAEDELRAASIESRRR